MHKVIIYIDELYFLICYNVNLTIVVMCLNCVSGTERARAACLLEPALKREQHRTDVLRSE